MFSKINLRKATEKDILAFIEIEKDAESKIYSAMTTKEEWQSELAKNNVTVFAIIKNSQVVGDVSYEIKDKNTAYISGLCISSKLQGQGIGKHTIKLILGKLKNFKRVELVTHPENKKAIKLYESLGFKKESLIENYFGDGEPRVKMILER